MNFRKAKRILKRADLSFGGVSLSGYTDSLFGNPKYFTSIYKSTDDMGRYCYNIHVDSIKPNKPYVFSASYSSGKEFEYLKKLYESYKPEIEW